MNYTHSKQLHRYRNRYFFTQECIKLLNEDEADYSNDADHKRSNVCLWNEGAHLQHSLEKKTQKGIIVMENRS